MTKTAKSYHSRASKNSLLYLFFLITSLFSATALSAGEFIPEELSTNQKNHKSEVKDKPSPFVNQVEEEPDPPRSEKDDDEGEKRAEPPTPPARKKSKRH